MRYPAAETAEKHERILTAAGQLFREKGFGDVSVAAVMTAASLTHGPFYNHFGSKRALIGESIDHMSAAALHDLAPCIGASQARATYLDLYLSRAHCEHPEGGCLMAALGAEIAREPEAKPAFTRHLRSIIGSLKGFFVGRGEQARGDAIHAIAAMVGGVVLARATEDPALADEILAEVRRRIDPA